MLIIELSNFSKIFKTILAFLLPDSARAASLNRLHCESAVSATAKKPPKIIQIRIIIIFQTSEVVGTYCKNLVKGRCGSRI